MSVAAAVRLRHGGAAACQLGGCHAAVHVVRLAAADAAVVRRRGRLARTEGRAVRESLAAQSHVVA